MDTQNTSLLTKLHSLVTSLLPSPLMLIFLKSWSLGIFLALTFVLGNHIYAKNFRFLLICIFAQNFLLSSKRQSSFLLDSSHLDIPQAPQTQRATSNSAVPRPQITLPLEIPDYLLLTQSLKQDTVELTYFCSPTLVP